MRSVFRLDPRKIKPILNTTVRRHAGDVSGRGIYRAMEPTMYYGPQIRVLKFLQITLWAWISYNFWYDPEFVFGHPDFEMSNPALWTDEELGIPPDDYDEVV